MYIILEIQTDAEGNVGTIVNKREDKNEAYSAYYQVLTAAAVSAVSMHSAVILDGTGAEIEHRCFSHMPAAAAPNANPSA